MERQRPDPDALLAALKDADKAKSRGKLNVFFGATAGVGKTYAMLEAAQRRRAEGADVVVGVVETHGRAETERLLAGLEILPRRERAYRGITLREFDLEAALKRRPALILMDEFAYANAPDGWHAKRWQDVKELLDAGLDVYTTLNVQHLESVNDLVARLTGIVVRETVPDALFDQADDVELVDLTPDDLLQRLREGKVYVPAQATRAMSNFFTEGNLIALRELALRRMADRVEAQMESFRRAHGMARSSALSDKLLVAVSPSPFAQRVVRAARRLAERLHAEWEVVYVERPTAGGISSEDRDRVFQTLRLAEQLGARTTTKTGENPAAELIRYAVERNIGRIIVGKPGHPRFRDRFGVNFVEELIQNNAGIDVYIVRGTAEEVVRRHARSSDHTPAWFGYLGAMGVIAACTLVGWPASMWFNESSTAMLYVLGTVLIALFFGRGPSILASVAGVLCYDYFFIQPRFTFAVMDARFVFTFLMILVVGNVIASLALQIKRQAVIARKHQRRAEAMYSLTRDLSVTESRDGLVKAVERNLSDIYGGEVVVLLPDENRRLSVPPGGGGGAFARDWRMPVAQWVFDHGQVAGLGTDTLPSSDSFFLPLNGNRGPVGVLGIRSKDPNLAQDSEQMLLLETLARNAAVALEQQDLVREAGEARMQAEAERMQNSLLASVSHDLRTPLASITGAASSLLESGETLGADKRRELQTMIHQEAERLSRLVTNLLQVTRLESGALRPNLDWQSVEEIVGAALRRMEAALAGRAVTVSIPADLPLLHVDALLVEQVLLNLLDNAAKHTPAGSPIEVIAHLDAGEVALAVADRGPGLPPGDEKRVFEKFYRGSVPHAGPGAGLGLAIVRGFVEAHGGRVAAHNRKDGGSEFEARFPVTPPPELKELEVGSDELESHRTETKI